MKTIKYPIKEIDIKTIPSNRILSLSITEKQKVLCEKSIRKYGLLTPIVLMENSSGEMMTLAGENELEILREMEVKKADVFTTSLKDSTDTYRIILLLSLLQKGLNALSEGLILQELIKVGKYTQKELAENLLKSQAWVSKRLALVGQLNEVVSEMVLSKQLCPTSAQYISQLPKEVQQQLAIQVYSKNIPKSTVEQLVSAYNRNDTPESFKEEIIRNPVSAANTLHQLNFERCRKKKETGDSFLKFDSSLRLLLRLINEIEVYLCNIGQNDLKKYMDVLMIVANSSKRFINLVEAIVSQGKFNSSIKSKGCARNGKS